MAAKLKIEKRGDEILIVHCCFSVSQNELWNFPIGALVMQVRIISLP
jgi:hypothetical protein